MSAVACAIPEFSREREVEAMQGMLAKLCQELDLEGVWYCYDIADHTEWGRRMKNGEQMVRSFVRRRRLFASSVNALELWQQQMSHYRNLVHLLDGIWTQDLYLWPMREMPEAMCRSLSRKGVAALVSITVACPLSSGFRGRFTLLLKDNDAVTALVDNMAPVQRRLAELQTRISLEFGKAINPLVDYNIVNPLSAYILGLIASGLDREQVSRQLRLTQRGVDYHVSVLKELLGARNIAQLVLKASQHQLI